MNVPRIGRVCVIGLLVVSLSMCVLQYASAASYQIPLRTATFAIDADEWPYVGQLGVSYALEVDPQVLQFGYDPMTGLYHETAIIVNWSDLLALPGTGGVVFGDLHLDSISFAGSTAFCLQSIWVSHAIPEASDFAWVAQYGGVIGINEVSADADGYSVPLPNQSVPYIGFVLTMPNREDAPVQVAGMNNSQGLHAPYIEVTVVPEPSSGVSLALICTCAVIILLGLRKRRGVLLTILAIMCVVLGAQAVRSQEIVDAILDSPPGTATRAVLTSMPAVPCTVPPEGFKYLPAFPRFFWSYGCAPTSGL
jgi:hypothetical protein